VHGVTTNIDFLQDVIAHPAFAQGRVSTRWVETEFGWTPPGEPSFEALIVASLSEFAIVNNQSKIKNQNEPDPYSPWKNPSGFRIEDKQ
jgi:pyruvate carboxylase